MKKFTIRTQVQEGDRRVTYTVTIVAETLVKALLDLRRIHPMFINYDVIHEEEV